MFRKIKTLLLLAIPVLLSSCISEDNRDDCGIYLEFIYNYNMDFTDSFDPKVNVVDVYVFNEEDKFLFTRRADCAADLLGRKRMLLSDDLSLGKTYQILTVGGLCEQFAFTGKEGGSLTPEVTTLEEVRLSLERTLDEVSHEFPHLWYSKETVEVHYRADLSVWPVHLVKNTNKFTIMLSKTDGTGDIRFEEGAPAPYTFEIITPEGAVYGYDNAPLVGQQVTYTPYQLTPGTEEGSLSVGRLNTMRLFDRKEDYRLIVRSTSTQKVLWDYDLMTILEWSKPENRPDGEAFPMHEYLDRKNEWKIIILHEGGDEEGGDLGVIGIAVEGCPWILWLHDIDL